MAEMAGYAAEYGLAAAAGDPHAERFLRSVQSWMVTLPPDVDGELAELFLDFARDDYAWWKARA